MPNSIRILDTFRSRKILVTGATGFVGSSLTRALAETGADIGIITRESSDLWRLSDCISGLRVVDADLLDLSAVTDGVRGFAPDIIFHLAAYGGKSGEFQDKRIFETNVLACANLLAAASGIPYSAFVNAGSSSEYGPMDIPMSEDALPVPETSYGKSKLMATLLCESAARTLRKPIVTLRLFSPYGGFEDARRLMPSAILPYLDGKAPKLGSADSVRDFVYIDDTVEGFLLAAAQIETVAGQVINIGSGCQHTVGEVSAIVKKLAGASVEPQWGETPSRLSEPAHWEANISKADRLMGWRPRHDLNSGLAETVEWYLNNRNKFGMYREEGWKA